MKAAATAGISPTIKTYHRILTSLLVPPLIYIARLTQSLKLVGDYTLFLPEAIKTTIKSILSEEINPAFVKSAGEMLLVRLGFIYICMEEQKMVLLCISCLCVCL